MHDIISMGNTGDTGPGAAGPSTLAQANENDGKIVINFYENDMIVRGDFYPPFGDGSPISPDYIRALIEKFRIVHGINKDEIRKAYRECVKDNRLVRDVLIARGDRPVNEILEYMQLNPYLGKFDLPEKDGDTVDHRARSPFVIVKKDQALAKQKSRKPGKEGRNVHGDSIGYSVIRPDGVSGGENTHMEGRLLLANINGQMVVVKKTVNVRDSLVIKGPVGYATGNIIFPGDVEIEGPVSDGFKIYSGGSVTIKQTFDVTDAVTKGDLTVAGGIIGRGQAMVKVGGALKTKFIDNCRAACRKTVTVDLEIVNSNVYTLESLEMSDKGRIVGGEIYSVKGVRAGAIGKKTGRAARIHCGLDFTVEQEKEKNNNILKMLAVKISRLKELLQDPETIGEKRAKMEALLDKLEEEQLRAQAKITELLGKLNACDSAAVEITGEIVPGTLIEICHQALFVTEPLKKVRVRLESGKLITEKL